MKNKRKVLVTAGNTRVPIDRVRGIDNIFKGRTGARIARYFALRGCDVTLLCSHPDTDLVDVFPHDAMKTIRFTTYDDLEREMEELIRGGTFDVVIHSAAVSDYCVDGMFERIDPGSPNIPGHMIVTMKELDRDGKISSNHSELWMKLVPTAKLIDKIRRDWGFKGTLVKFKLQVGMLDEKLVEIATSSMKQSGANFIVANTLEGMTQRAYIISAKGGIPVMIGREELPAALYQELGL